MTPKTDSSAVTILAILTYPVKIPTSPKTDPAERRVIYQCLNNKLS
jgi:hypothetical protein